MRIGMIARVLPRPDYAGGVSGQVHLLATALVRRGHAVTVHALPPAPPGAAYAFRPLRVPAFAARRPFAAAHAVALAARAAAAGDYDVIHAHGDDHLLPRRRPVVRTFYGTSRAEAAHARTARQWLHHAGMILPERIAAARATALVAISRSAGRHLGRPFEVVPCGYDPGVFAPGGARSAAPSILFVGDLGTRKRAELLLDVFARVVRPARPDAELWMVTTAPVAAPGVRWLGRVRAAALADLYRRAWVFCLPSAYEGFGVPYVEAMACGTPCVGTPNGGAEEIFAEGAGGRVVTDAELGRALTAVLAAGPAGPALADAAARAAARYRIERVAERYEAVYARARREAGGR